ncbi:MAG: SH3 domain-containing protein [Thermomicrobiales bacterium]
MSRRAVLAAGFVLAGSRAAAAQSDTGLTKAGRWVEAEQVGVSRAEAVGDLAPEPIVFRTPWPVNAAAPHWSAKERAGATLEVSFSTDGTRWSEPVTVTEDADSGRPNRDSRRYGNLVMAEPGRYIRYRSFNADGKAASLRGLAWEYIDSSEGAGAARASQPGRQEPQSFSRADWGADESLRYQSGWEFWPPEYATVSHVILHHSDTANTGDAMVAIRALYYFHAVTRGWGDLGYNAIVDHLGNRYEGRAGGEGVIGGHTQGYNEGTCGILALGKANGDAPTPDLLAGIARAAGAATRWLDPLGEAPLGDFEALPVICSHSDVNDTGCPGDVLAAALPGIRQQARAAIDQSAAPEQLRFSPGDPVATTTEGVSLREGPGRSYPAMTTLAAAEPLVIADGPKTSDGLTWYQVEGSSQEGWTAADYLVAISTPDMPDYAIGGPTGPIPDGDAPDATTSDAPPPPRSTRYGTGATVEIVEVDLNLRDAPAGSVLETLPVGAWLVITGAPEGMDGTTWFPVDAGDGRLGWVSAEYVRPFR